MLRWAGSLVTGTLVSAAAYELALAFGAGSLGPLPGEGVTGSGFVEAAALLAMLAAVVLGIANGFRPWRGSALLGPAAAAYLVTFYFTFDPYFAPHLRRYSEGNVGGTWIAVVAAAALGVGVLAALRPRAGTAMTSVVVPLVFLTTLLAGDGH